MAGLVKACKAKKFIYKVFAVISQRVIDKMSLNLV